MAGLQGSGKTTTAAKLALFVKQRLKRRVALVSADVYRPAAIEQLEVLAGEVGAQFIGSSADEVPAAIAERAVAEAKRKLADVLIVDTAGRLAIDEAMMQEIQILQQRLQPIETLFVVDAMTGQDAAATAKAFNEVLDLTGVVLTKADGGRSGRGGPFGSLPDRQAHQVHRHGREDRRLGALPSGPAGVAHSRHGGHALPHRGGGAQG